MSAPIQIGILTCEKHLDEPCDGGHNFNGNAFTRQNCTYCPASMLALEDECMYCRKLPEYRGPGAPLLDYERAYQTLYVGIRGSSAGGLFVTFRHDDGSIRSEAELPQRPDLWNGGGFEWGYGGSGPSCLAMCLLAHVTGDGPYALAMRHKFKWDVIAKLDQDKHWELTGSQIMNWVQERPITREKRFRWLPENERNRLTMTNEY